MRTLKINLTVEDEKTKEILIVTGDLGVLRDLMSGVKIAMPQYTQAEGVDVQAFIDDIGAKIKFNDPKHRVQSQDLYDAYKEWCEKNGHRLLSSTRVARDWERFGLTHIKINGLNYWVGIKL